MINLVSIELIEQLEVIFDFYRVWKMLSKLRVLLRVEKLFRNNWKEEHVDNYNVKFKAFLLLLQGCQLKLKEIFNISPDFFFF